MAEQTTETPASPESRAARRSTSAKRRRRWLRWAANLMIIGGVLLLAYPIGTWAYTWFEQRDLRSQLQQAGPKLIIPAAVLPRVQFTPAAEPPGSTGSTMVDTASTPVTAPAAAAASSAATTAEAQQQAQLAAFKAAAAQFATTVGWKVGTPLGRIVIPSIGVDVVMVEGTGKGDLREGPGHWPETPFPGQGGNFVVSGHRTTYGAPFRKLNKVKAGDEIFLVLPYGVARYTVTRTMIVDPKDVKSVAQAGKEQVSLAACHPIYSARQRIVVQGDLAGFSLTGPSG
jgi:LPXTG-site transpeptidase (sortase) family protein